MTSIDERIVSMAFENDKFERGVAQTMGTLKKLEDSLKRVSQNQSLSDIEKSADKVTLKTPMSAMDKLRAKFGKGTETKTFEDLERSADKVTLSGPARAFDKLQGKMDKGLDASKSFANVEAASDKVTLSGISSAIDSVSARFSLIEGAAAVAFGNIATKAIIAGTQMAKGFAIDPVKQGLDEYGLKLNATQTIMSSTGEKIGPVNKALAELNKYSDRTIYSFKDMIDNIPKFTNAGVPLQQSVKAIQGIAQVAAVAGANTEEAARAMFNFGQAMGTGAVRAIDWRSIDLANMGTIQFKQQLIDTAVAMHTLKKQGDGTYKTLKGTAVSSKNFTDGLKDQWLTTKVLTKTLAKYTDEQTALGRHAFQSATDIKTLSQLMGVWKESIGSGWAASFENIFGNLAQAKKLWGGVNDVIGKFINNSSNARNKILSDWKQMGGRADLFRGLKNVFEALMAILKPIKDAFREIFPRKTGQELAEMSKNFADFTENLKIGKKTASDLKHIFAGVFAVFHAGWSVVKALVGVIFDLFGSLGSGSGDFLSFLANIGDFLVMVDKAVSKGGALSTMFKAIYTGLKPLLDILGDVGAYIASVFGFGDPQAGDKLAASFMKMGDGASFLSDIIEKLISIWKGFLKVFNQVVDFLQPFADAIVEGVKEIRDWLKKALDDILSDKGINLAQTGLLAGIFVMIRKGLKGINIGISTDTVTNLNTTLKALTGSLAGLETAIHAAVIVAIAVAIALLAGSIVLLASVNATKMQQALTTIGVGLVEMGAAIQLMGKMSTGTLKIVPLALSFVILAGALILLGIALHILARLSWHDMEKGLTGMGAALMIVGRGIMFINPVTLTAMAPALVVLALAMNLMAIALTIMGKLSWDEISRGLIALGGSLVMLGLGLAFLNPLTIAALAPGLLVVSIAMNFVAAAMARMGSLDWDTIAKGLIAIGGGLAMIGLGMQFMPLTIGVTAAGMLLAAIALNVVGAAIGLLGQMKFSTLAKGLIAMAFAFDILAMGLYAMEGTMPGSLALLTAAGAMAIMVPALGLLGSLPILVIVKGLVAMVAILGALALVGLVAAVPIAAVGEALLILGYALLAIAGSVLIFATAMRVFALVGSKGLVVLGATVVGILALVPKLLKDFMLGIVEVLGALAKLLPQVAVSLGLILDTIIAFVIQAAPKLAVAIGALVDAILFVLLENGPKIQEAGFQLLINLLKGIYDHLDEVVTKAAAVMNKFMEGLQRESPRLIASGLKTMLVFLSGIQTGIPKIVSKVAEMIVRFLVAIKSQIPKIQLAGAELILKFITGINAHINGIIAAGAAVLGKFMVGIGNKIPELVTKGLFVAKQFINGIADGLSGMGDLALKGIIRFLHSLEASIRANSTELINAGVGVGDAIFDGVAQAIDKAAGPIIEKLKWVFSKLPHAVKKVLGIASPSREFATIGHQTIEGFAVGVIEHRSRADTAVTSVAKGAMQSFSKAVIDRRTDPTARFKEVGKRSVQGLQEGIKEGGAGVNGAISGITNGMLTTIKDLLGVASPSKVLREIGKEVGRGFKQGLDGSADDIRNSFRSMNDKLRAEMQSARKSIRDEHKKLEDLEQQHADKLKEIRKLKNAKKPDEDAIKTATQELRDIERQENSSSKALNKYWDILRGTSQAHTVLVGNLQASKDWLVVLSTELDKVTDKLDAANQELDRLTNERTEFAKSIKDQFSKLPDIDKDAQDPVADYKQKLKDQIAATRKFYETMKKLRAAGLDDVTFKRMLADGIGDQDFADQLLRTGERGISEVNNLDTQLSDLAGEMGTNVAGSLYDVGVNAAQGLVDGLKARSDELKAVMVTIADSIVAAIKTALGIHSPSKIFKMVGKFAAQGLAQGFKEHAKAVSDAASQVGTDAVSAMQQTIAEMSNAVGDNLDIEPVITPVLDLSQIQKDASKLGDLTNVTPITAAASYGQATAISAQQAAVAADATAIAQPLNHVELTQNNYSPESLSDIEIYRQTNNQMAQLKRALGLTNV